MDCRETVKEEEKINLEEEQTSDSGLDQPDHPSEDEDRAEELRKCREQVLRLAAELENFKKRVEREKAEHMKYALEAFAKELLPFLDNLERALETARETGDMEKLIEGLDLTLSGYLKTLERFGLKVYSSAGQRFDPNYHEALSVQESDEYEHNTVVNELLKGYLLHEKVLRPALVVVSKKNAKDSGQ